MWMPAQMVTSSVAIAAPSVTIFEVRDPNRRTSA
jgi:hypothetical protein